MSVEVMRGLKAEKDEELRLEKIKRCIDSIYRGAVHVAQTSGQTSYSLDIDPQQTRRMREQAKNRGVTIDLRNTEYQFYKDNITEILSELQHLFPGCNVKLANMCSGNDGKRYDISAMDEKMLPFINQQNAFECILIDWT